MIDVAAEVASAERRIAGRVRETWVEESPTLAAADGRLLLKLECLQHTGSFKVRGALAKILTLPEERRSGVVAASTGNHGAAVAWACREVGGSATVFVPRRASPTKVAAIRRLGAEVLEHGDDPVETEAEARRFAAEQERSYVPPYNDPQVIGGQGTVAAELLRQAPDVGAIVVPLGGGGLAAGIAGYCRRHRPDVRVVAASPARSPVMIESVRAGRILDLPSEPTLADGTAGGVEPGSITFPLVRDGVDQLVTVDEEEIVAALRQVVEIHHLLIEGSAAVALAAYHRLAANDLAGSVAVVLTGANVSRSTLVEVLGR